MTSMMEGLIFDCQCGCGRRVTGLPAITFDCPEPDLNDDGQPWELERDGKDFCVADDQYYFVRAVLSVPIVGETQRMEWGVWALLSEADFKRYYWSFEDDDLAKLGIMYCYLANSLAGYPDTVALRGWLIPQDGSQRPFVEFDPSQNHPLVNDQLWGISRERAIELVLPELHHLGRA
jgi:hypothetical protein